MIVVNARHANTLVTQPCSLDERNACKTCIVRRMVIDARGKSCSSRRQILNEMRQDLCEIAVNSKHIVNINIVAHIM